MTSTPSNTHYSATKVGNDGKGTMKNLNLVSVSTLNLSILPSQSFDSSRDDILGLVRKRHRVTQGPFVRLKLHIRRAACAYCRNERNS